MLHQHCSPISLNCQYLNYVMLIFLLMGQVVGIGLINKQLFQLGLQAILFAHLSTYKGIEFQFHLFLDFLLFQILIHHIRLLNPKAMAYKFLLQKRLHLNPPSHLGKQALLPLVRKGQKFVSTKVCINL